MLINLFSIYLHITIVLVFLSIYQHHVVDQIFHFFPVQHEELFISYHNIMKLTLKDLIFL